MSIDIFVPRPKFRALIGQIAGCDLQKNVYSRFTLYY